MPLRRIPVLVALPVVALFATGALAGPAEPAPTEPVATEPPAVEPAAPEPAEPAAPEPEPEPEPEPPASAPPAATQPPPAATQPPPATEATSDAKPEAKPVKDDEEVSPLMPEREGRIFADKNLVDHEKTHFKPGKGIKWVSKNERFALALRLRAQFLYELENDNDAGEQEHTLMIRRARLQFVGHFWNKHNKFKTELAVSPRDQGFDGTPRRTPILDWYLDFDYLRDLTIRVGQYKVPYSRQRVVSSGNLQLVDRALANGEFNLDRDIGVDIRSKDFLGLDKLRYYAGAYMGEGRDNYQLSNFEMFYLARVEVLPFGSFKDYSEADFERSSKPRLSLGTAYAFVDGAVRNRGILGSAPTDGGTTDYHSVTADFMFKIVGLSVTGEFFYRNGKRKFGDATLIDEDTGEEVAAERELARNGLGWFAQAGYLLPRTSFELAARYSQVRRLGDSSVPHGDEVGGGVSYYFARHPLKLQLDYFRQWKEYELSNGVDQIRLQLQAAF